MKYRSIHLAITVVALSAMACATKDEVAALKKEHAELAARVEQLEKSGAGQAGRRGKAARPLPGKVYAFPVGDSAAKGSKDAWVTLITVSDFQCPFCKRVNPTLKQVMDKYKDDVRVVFKHNPLSFHNRALPAALAAECAHEQDKFWEMHDKLFGDQRALDDATMQTHAQEVGLDVKAWTDCYKALKPKARIEADQRAASSFGARGTPAFFINGRYISGAQPLESFAAIIDEELKKARDSGISKSDYYKKAVLDKGAKTL
jgi:protein-disulfide isomerase